MNPIIFHKLISSLVVVTRGVSMSKLLSWIPSSSLVLTADRIKYRFFPWYYIFHHEPSLLLFFVWIMGAPTASELFLMATNILEFKFSIT